MTVSVGRQGRALKRITIENLRSGMPTEASTTLEETGTRLFPQEIVIRGLTTCYEYEYEYCSELELEYGHAAVDSLQGSPFCALRNSRMHAPALMYMHWARVNSGLPPTAPPLQCHHHSIRSQHLDECRQAPGTDQLQLIECPENELHIQWAGPPFTRIWAEKRLML